MSIFKEGHALLIGVGADLPNTVTDAKGLANILNDPERCAYPAAQVTVLVEEQAKRDAVLASFDQLAAKSNSNSTVVIYFSGHGYEITTLTGKAYFLMPFGYKINALSTTAISGAELMAKLKAIPAQKMLVLLDCCHAGGIDNAKAPGAEFAKSPIPPEAQELLAQGSGRVIIASSQANEVSFAGDPYSEFTQALLEALTGEGASKRDGCVRAADLAMYPRETVPSQTNGQQHPVLHFEQADNFVVAYYAGGETKAKGLPASAQRKPKTEESQPIVQSTASTVTNSGSGGLAQGGGTAAGERGVAIGGNVSGSTIVTGNRNRIDQSSRVFDQRRQTVHGNQTNVAGNITTDGGMFNAGYIDTAGGDFVGRDINYGSTTEQIGHLLAPLLAIAQSAPVEKRDQAIKTAEALQQEAAKGKRANDSLLAELMENLVGLLPGAVNAVVSAFASPILVGIVGPVTKHVLKRLGVR